MRNPYLTNCVECSATTSRAHAKTHDGKCKACATGLEPHGLKCPDCGQATLTTYQKRHGYHCDGCTRETDPVGYANEVRGFND